MLPPVQGPPGQSSRLHARNLAAQLGGFRRQQCVLQKIRGEVPPHSTESSEGVTFLAVVIGDKLAMNKFELIVLDMSNSLKKFSFRYSQLCL